jgi:large subunit ribosomal protein L29
VKVKEVRENSTEELKNLLEELRRKMFDLRSQAVTEKLEDPSLIRKTKDKIARILMVLRERDVKDLDSQLHHLEKTHTTFVKPAKKK